MRAEFGPRRGCSVGTPAVSAFLLPFFILACDPLPKWERLLHNRKAVGKAQDIKGDSIVAGTVGGRFHVSSSNSGKSYEVDVQRGFCDCYVGASGACCKHQIAVANKEGLVLPNIPIVSTSEQRVALCHLALGPHSLSASFFGSTLPG